jgi:hypothetical protein
LGSTGNVTPLHFDGTNNLLAQVFGHKSLKLFPPDQTKHLYPMPAFAKFGHLSEVDLDQPDLHRFPLLERAKPIEVILEPGDVLFLPAFWWHHVRSMALSISINFWWRAHASQLLAPNATRLLVGMFDRDRLRGLGANVSGGLLALARYACNEARVLWVATLCVVGALDQHLRELLRKNNVDDENLPGRLSALYSRLSKVADLRGPTLDNRKLDHWMRMSAAARSADDIHLSGSDVREMIDQVRVFIESYS